MANLPDIPSYELERIEQECASAGVLDEYRRLVAAGTYPRGAAMYALQQPSGSRNTDRAFCQGQRRKMEGMSPVVAKMLHDRARTAGIDTAGKYYMSGVGRATDPAAWVTCAEDLLTVAKQRNLNLEGVINRKALPEAHVEKPEVLLAPDLVREFANKELAKDPALRERVAKNKHARRELYEQVTEKHGKRKRFKKTIRLR